jgi:hypothetical protein
MFRQLALMSALGLALSACADKADTFPLNAAAKQLVIWN